MECCSPPNPPYRLGRLLNWWLAGHRGSTAYHWSWCYWVAWCAPKKRKRPSRFCDTTSERANIRGRRRSKFDGWSEFAGGSVALARANLTILCLRRFPLLPLRLLRRGPKLPHRLRQDLFGDLSQTA